MNTKTRNDILDTVDMMLHDPKFEIVDVSQCLGGSAPHTCLLLADGRIIEAIVRAQDVLGNFTVVLPSSGIRQYLKSEVA